MKNFKNKMGDLYLVYVISVEARVRAILVRLTLSGVTFMYSIILFLSLLGVFNSFGKIEYIMYLGIIVFVNIFIYSVSITKFMPLMHWYLDFLYKHPSIFFILLQFYFEIYISLFKLPFLGISIIFLFYLGFGNYGLLFLGSLIVFIFFSFNSFLYFLEYIMMSESIDKWYANSQILDDLMSINPILLPFDSVFPLKIVVLDDLNRKGNLFVHRALLSFDNYAETRRWFTPPGPRFVNQVIVGVNGKIAAAGAGAGALGGSAFLISEQLKKRQQLKHDAEQREKQLKHDAEQREKDRQLERDQMREDSRHRDADRQLERDKMGNNGYLQGLFGRGNNKPKVLESFDFFNYVSELLYSLLSFLGNSIFISVFLNFFLAIFKILVIFFRKF